MGTRPLTGTLIKAGTPGATTVVSIALELPAAPAIATPMAVGCIPPASILKSVVEAGVVIAPWTGSPAVPAEDGCRGVELVLGKYRRPPPHTLVSARLDLTSLDQAVEHYFRSSIAPNSQLPIGLGTVPEPPTPLRRT